MNTNKLLWKPDSNIYNNDDICIIRFLKLINSRSEQTLKNYEDLYNWSINNPEKFWGLVWEFFSPLHSRKYGEIVKFDQEFHKTSWFQGAKLNFAENLLRFRDKQTAIISWNEFGRKKTLTYEQLYSEVAKMAEYLKGCGVEANDRVIGIMPNIPEAIIGMLAATSIGAMWSSASPDLGAEALIDRFVQIEPKVLLTVDGYYYKRKTESIVHKIDTIVQKISSLKKILLVSYIGEASHKFDHWEVVRKNKAHVDKINFFPGDFDHPLYILFSSGTTGKPKCIVHGAGRVLIEHLKELVLHCDLKRSDTIFYQTTCSWMMWNWLVSSLAVGAKLVLFDGAPLENNGEILWQMAEKEKVTVFGTNARFLALLEKNKIDPYVSNDLSSIRLVLSTGSPLTVKGDSRLCSISGGTDIVGCFALCNPISSRYELELQGRSLGIKVEVFDEEGKSLVNKTGELVCTAPFPTMPLYFWNDKDNQKYKATYFNRFKNVWCHGDYVQLTDRGTMIFYGRSDTTLNPGGVRIGTAEIYNVLLTDDFPEIVDCVAVAKEQDGDQVIALFVKLRNEVALSDELIKRIGVILKEKTSRYHIPKIIKQVPDIPKTFNNKIAESAVTAVVNGREVKNLGALINPESLGWFK